MPDERCCSCGTAALARVSPRAGLTYFVCNECGHCEKLLNLGDPEREFEDAQARYFDRASAELSPGTTAIKEEGLKRRAAVLSRFLCPGSTVIEVGPGDGAVLRWLHEAGHRAVGVEHAPEMARQLADRTRADLRVGEFEKIDLGGETFDAVCSFHVIEHVREPRAHVARAFEIVKAGGFGFLATPNSRSWEQRVPGNLSPNFDSAHLRVFSSESLMRLCESVGWQILEVKTPEYSSGWLRVLAKLVRRAMRHDEEGTAGRYAGMASGRGKAILTGFSIATSPLRRVQEGLGAGNELFFVLRKPAATPA